MLRTPAPSILLVDRVHEFNALLPRVYDGAEDAIHDARVALRRMSEALSLVRDQYDEHALAAIEARLSKAARALGRVRDADTGQRVIQEVEQRFPFAAATLGRLRTAGADRQYKSRRKAIKKLEALELQELPQILERAWQRPSRRWPPAWKATALRQVALRAEDLRSSIARATGVYFSKRAHSTRTAIKQLRYTLELAAALGVPPARKSIRLLKKAQDVLGAAHDRDVLLDRLETLRGREAESIDAVEADALARFLRAETLALHQRYINWREDVLAICDVCTASPRRGITAARIAMVAGVGLPSLLLLARNSASARTE
jgi:CHAD domain-containing protein